MKVKLKKILIIKLIIIFIIFFTFLLFSNCFERDTYYQKKIELLKDSTSFISISQITSLNFSKKIINNNIEIYTYTIQSGKGFIVFSGENIYYDISRKVFKVYNGFIKYYPENLIDKLFIKSKGEIYLKLDQKQNISYFYVEGKSFVDFKKYNFLIEAEKIFYSNRNKYISAQINVTTIYKEEQMISAESFFYDILNKKIEYKTNVKFYLTAGFLFKEPVFIGFYNDYLNGISNSLYLDLKKRLIEITGNIYIKNNEIELSADYLQVGYDFKKFREKFLILKNGTMLFNFNSLSYFFDGRSLIINRYLDSYYRLIIKEGVFKLFSHHKKFINSDFRGKKVAVDLYFNKELDVDIGDISFVNGEMNIIKDRNNKIFIKAKSCKCIKNPFYLIKGEEIELLIDIPFLIVSGKANRIKMQELKYYKFKLFFRDGKFNFKDDNFNFKLISSKGFINTLNGTAEFYNNVKLFDKKNKFYLKSKKVFIQNRFKDYKIIDGAYIYKLSSLPLQVDIKLDNLNPDKEFNNFIIGKIENFNYLNYYFNKREFKVKNFDLYINYKDNLKFKGKELIHIIDKRIILLKSVVLFLKTRLYSMIKIYSKNYILDLNKSNIKFSNSGFIDFSNNNIKLKFRSGNLNFKDYKSNFYYISVFKKSDIILKAKSLNILKNKMILIDNVIIYNQNGKVKKDKYEFNLNNQNSGIE